MPPSVIEVFGVFGCQFSLDWDGQLIVKSQGWLTDEVSLWIFRHQLPIRSSLEWTGRRGRQVYVGGTLNGRRHYHSLSPAASTVHVRVAPRHWETYKYRSSGITDPRLFFVGRATSKVKAKAGVYVDAKSK
jgi:hypothetical protein